ncbi:MAG: ribonuclease E activity regulator RraA [Dongia sp.]|jgi:regulator of ribonuclease activity A
MAFSTADLWDAHHAEIGVIDAQFRGFGLRRSFSGPCVTVKTPGDHRQVRALAVMPGEGRVIVVDGGSLMQVALLGDRIATAAMANGWAGIVALGAIRDSAAIDALNFGVKALGTIARRAETEVGGETDIDLTLGRVKVRSGDWIYADPDAVVVSPRRLA